MSVDRIKMPKRHDGKRVADRFMCNVGHLHPSHGGAVKCNNRKTMRKSKS